LQIASGHDSDSSKQRYSNCRTLRLLPPLLCCLNSHKWLVGEWTACESRLNCGQGLQNRTVLCVQVHGNKLIPRLHDQANIELTSSKCI